MKVKTLIKKLQELGEKYQDAIVTIQDPYTSLFIPIDYKIETNYCKKLGEDRCDTIIILKETKK